MQEYILSNKLVSFVANGPRDARPTYNWHAKCRQNSDRPGAALFAAPARSIRRRRNKQPAVVVFIDLLTALMKPAAMMKFSKSSILDKVSEGSALIFGLTRISLQHSVE